MTDEIIRSASLAEIRKMKAAGELLTNTDLLEGQPEGGTLGPGFWKDAWAEEPKGVNRQEEREETDMSDVHPSVGESLEDFLEGARRERRCSDMDARMGARPPHLVTPGI